MKQILLLCLAFCAINLSAQNEWNFLGEYDAIYAFRNAQNFIYIENNFELKITTDGGATATTSNYIPGLLTPALKGYYLNDNTLFMVQQDGPGVIKLIKSTDAGMNFTDIGVISLPEGYQFGSRFHVYFFDEKTGIVHLRSVLDGDPIDIIVKTEDGGSSWSLAAEPDFSDGATEMDFFGSAGMRLYRSSDVQETTDLGATWGMLGSHPLLASRQFASQGDLIWGVGDGGADNPCNAISTDGGASFSEWNIPDFANGGFDDCGERIASINASSLMVTGHENGFQNEVTLHSTDGGQIFTNIADNVQHGRMLAVPYKFVAAMMERGWILNDTIVWSKVNPVFQAHKRSVASHEYIFHFVKTVELYYDRSWIGNGDFTKQDLTYGGNGKVKSIRSHWKFDGHTLTTPVPNNHDLRIACEEEGLTLSHSATFPREIPLVAILSTTKPGDLVVDMFNGTGTTGEVAVSNGRRYVGYDLSSLYLKFSEVRMGQCLPRHQQAA